MPGPTDNGPGLSVSTSAPRRICRRQQIPVAGQCGIHGKGHARWVRQFDFGVGEQLGEVRDYPVEEEKKGPGQRDQHDFGVAQG